MLTRVYIVSLVAALAVPAVVACKDPGDDEPDCDADHAGAERDCDGGTQFCVNDPEDDTRYQWGVCVERPDCTPGEPGADGCSTCVVTPEGVPSWDDTECDSDWLSTPLVRP